MGKWTLPIRDRCDYDLHELPTANNSNNSAWGDVSCAARDARTLWWQPGEEEKLTTRAASPALHLVFPRAHLWSPCWRLRSPPPSSPWRPWCAPPAARLLSSPLLTFPPLSECPPSPPSFGRTSCSGCRCSRLGSSVPCPRGAVRCGAVWRGEIPRCALAQSRGARPTSALKHVRERERGRETQSGRERECIIHDVYK